MFSLEENNNHESKTPKATSATVEISPPPDYGQMADLFTQMANMAKMLGNMRQDNSEKLSEEFDAVMKMKAEEEHIKAFTGKRQIPQYDTS